LKYSLYLAGIVVAILLVLSLLPAQLTGVLGLHNTDILSDIRKDTANTVVERKLVLLPSPPEIDDIPCPDGMVCFEDYSQNAQGMRRFFEALDHSDKKVVRIAFFGDSYIEGDIFSGDLRADLQTEYGGRGVGLVMPQSPVSGFRRTVKHYYGGWNSYSIIESRNYSKMGIAGNYFTPDSAAAWVKYTTVPMPHIDYFRKVSILYSLPEGSAHLSYRINSEKENRVALEPSAQLSRYDIAADSVTKVSLAFSGSKLYVYGISLQDTTGVVVDNFSLRGTPGTTLRYLPENILVQTDSLLCYDLIILQYGLNVMMPTHTNYDRYRQEMVKTVQHLQKCFPQSSILLLSVGDRSMRRPEGYVTMPGAPALVQYQRQVCEQTGIVFWNLFEAMGGSGSMPELVNAKPPKANKDYTHLNFEGGKYLGDILFKTLLFEKKRYDQALKYKKQ
jgi:lysophospholipase L1-like esterase